MSASTTLFYYKICNISSRLKLANRQFVVPPLGGSVWRHGMDLHPALPPKGWTTSCAFHCFSRAAHCDPNDSLDDQCGKQILPRGSGDMRRTTRGLDRPSGQSPSVVLARQLDAGDVGERDRIVVSARKKQRARAVLAGRRF